MLRFYRLFLLSAMLALPASMQLAWADTPKAATHDDAALAKYERIMFGQQKHQGNQEERLEAIEGSLFGKRQHGSIEHRLQAIGKMLEPQTHHSPASASSAPPVAPAHHRPAHETTSVSTPSHHEQVSAQKEDTERSATMQKGHVSILEEKEQDSTALMDKAMKAYQSGNTIEAAQFFQQVTLVDNQNADAHFNLGVLAENKGNLQQALARYKAALALSPQDGEYQGAVEAVEKKLQANATFNQTRLARMPEAENQAVLPVTSPAISGEHHHHRHHHHRKHHEHHSSLGRALGTAAVLGIGIAGSAGGVDIACPVCRILRLH